MAAYMCANSRSKGISFNLSILQDLFQILMASGFLILCSQIKIPLPFSPIPLTLQTLAVLIIGATLGSRKGACALLCYFAEIAMGLPVLSGGMSDPLVFIGPKGGYILGFFVQAFLMGKFVEIMPSSFSKTLFIGGLFACAVQMTLGVAVLAQFVGWSSAWVMGFYPFIVGEILKVSMISTGLNYLKSVNKLGSY